MMPGFNPGKMQAMMKQLGIKQEEIDAKRVIIEKEGERIIIDNPSVTKINMQGNESWQVVGEARVEEEGISEEDIKIVMEKTGADEAKAKEALENANGDLTEAIMALSG